MQKTGKLAGIRVWVTRPHADDGRGDRLVDSLREQAADVGHFPVLQSESIDFSADFRAASAQLGALGSVVFLSPRAVRAAAENSWFREWLEEHPETRLVAIGAGTALEARNRFGLPVPYPPIGNSRELAEWLPKQKGVEPAIVLRAAQGSNDLETGLSRQRFRFRQIAAYRTRPVERLGDDFDKWQSQGDIDWVTATSPRIARSVFDLASATRPSHPGTDFLRDIKFATLSETISECVRQFGGTVGAEAREPTMDSLVQAIVNAVEA